MSIIMKYFKKLFDIFTALINENNFLNSFFIINNCRQFLILIIITTTLEHNLNAQDSFLDSQLKYERVSTAVSRVKPLLERKYSAIMGSLGDSVVLRAYKNEGILEVWTKSEVLERFTLLTTYKICESSGVLGPKRKEGDLQTPEGIYYINVFNPSSNYHLSLGINYPNKSDLILSDKESPGGDIYIHGNCMTIGCIPITDQYIEELYVICMYSKNAGQDSIPVMVFPMKMNNNTYSSFYNALPNSSVKTFWKNLKPLHDYFEAQKKLPEYNINEQGLYELL